ncbi:FG-GAP repeat domain-containing protein [Tahibacter harae]|uniref:VCBS repeat-containing protein n=1 Tax=Tahibacter harae TaxID=2963937 RepID=A0ABT1QVD9_9GAMM|nr:VCBS repeat-containing protein [Tahibacter harae]MCQ4166243.1 VCBS repeat-containing protein [Tahibacter harae]
MIINAGSLPVRLAALAALLAVAAGAAAQPYSVSYGDRWSLFPYNFSAPIAGGLDLNGDGRSDLIVPLASGPARLYLSQGNGRFVRKTLPFWAPQEIEALAFAGGDFDGDGRVDLAYTGDSRQVRVLRNLGGANFRHVQAIPTQSSGESARLSALVSGDFNGDGKVDLVALDRGRDTTPAGTSALLVWGQAGGQFAAAASRLPTAGGAIWAAAGDFTGDGRADLLTGNRTGDVSLSHYDSSTATPRLLASLRTYTGVEEARVEGLGSGHINDDNRLDAAAVFSYTPANAPNTRLYLLRTLRNNGTATALQWSGEAQMIEGCFASNTSVRLGDYNGDTKTDVLVSCINGIGGLLYGRGDFTFDAPVYLSLPEESAQGVTSRGLARGDYDGDGRLDIAVVTQRGLRVLRYDPAADRLFADGFQSAAGAAAAAQNTFVE